MKQCYVFVCLVLCIVNLNADADFDIDYYFGSGGLRSKSVKRPRFLYKRTQPDEQNPPGFLDLTKMSVYTNVQYYDEYPPKPVLRHHIAHFCPNLDEARTCIRKCMPLGKPAFCGKDHVCYCGHKYKNSPAKEPVNVKNVYAQFKDLYQKYFGNNHHGFESSEEED